MSQTAQKRDEIFFHKTREKRETEKREVTQIKAFKRSDRIGSGDVLVFFFFFVTRAQKRDLSVCLSVSLLFLLLFICESSSRDEFLTSFDVFFSFRLSIFLARTFSDVLIKFYSNLLLRLEQFFYSRLRRSSTLCPATITQNIRASKRDVFVFYVTSFFLRQIRVRHLSRRILFQVLFLEESLDEI